MGGTLKKLLRQAPALLGVVLFVGAIYVVQKEFRHLKIADISRALAAMPGRALAISFVWTLIAYGILTFYDRLATIFAGKAVSYGKVAFASFCAYALAHNLGFAAVSGAAVRYRLYAHWGLTPLQIGKVVAFCSATFAFGALVLAGAILFYEPESIPFFGAVVPVWGMYAVGAALWVVVAAYIGLSRLLGSIRVFGHVVELPGFGMALLQVLLATLDVVATAAIFYVLLPDAPGLTYLRFLGIYLASYSAGLIANLPGGLGVFDTAMLLGLEPYLAPPEIVSAILIFRLYYYIIPLFLAGGLFAGNEVLLRGRGIFRVAARTRSVQAIGQWSQPDFAIAACTGIVALCGALLMGVGVLENFGGRLVWSGSFFWIIGEMDEFVPSLLGAALVVLAAAMAQRVRLAWGGSLTVLLLGAAFTLLYGAPMWIPAVLLLAAAMIAPFHRAFYRSTGLLRGPLRAGTVMPLLVLILSVVAMGSFEPRLRWLDSNSFWKVILSPQVPNSLRASIALFLLLGAVALWRILRPARTEYSPWTGETQARLAAMGGKVPAEADGVVWSEYGGAAIVFRRLGRILLALGDPTGAADGRVSAIWRLRDLARQEGLDPAIWRAGPDLLQVYGDIGLAALPLGPDGMPIGDAEDAPGPHAQEFLVCVAERDLPLLLPILPKLAAE